MFTAHCTPRPYSSVLTHGCSHLVRRSLDLSLTRFRHLLHLSPTLHLHSTPILPYIRHLLSPLYTYTSQQQVPLSNHCGRRDNISMPLKVRKREAPTLCGVCVDVVCMCCVVVCRVPCADIPPSSSPLSLLLPLLLPRLPLQRLCLSETLRRCDAVCSM